MSVIEAPIRFVKAANIKEEAKSMIDRLPNDLTWERLQYHIAVRLSIEKGLQDARNGKLVSEEDVDDIIDKWLVLK